MSRDDQSDEELERYTQIRRELESRWPESKIAPSLDRIQRLVDLLGDPQDAYPVIHLTGTNGKTSTARMVESLLRAFGLHTGLVTSPHLTDMRERIRINGEPVELERFMQIYDEVAPVLEIVDGEYTAKGEPALTFFEVMVGLAYATFADAPVDVAVVEVGMGGTWDATNVANGQVAVVTPVSLDHAAYLGDTIGEIATEKSGIIKEGAIAIIAAQDEEAEAPLLARCEAVGAQPALEGRHFGVVDRNVAVGGQMLTLRGLGGEYSDIFLPLFGPYQAHNAATALAAVEAFLGGGQAPLDMDNVRDGFAMASSPGRLEVVRRSPTIIVDAAHNLGGAEALVDALEDSFTFSTLVGVVGVLTDKDAEGILGALEPALDAVVISQSASPRALPADQLGLIAEEIFGEDRVIVVPRLDDAIDAAVALAEVSALDALAESGIPDALPSGVGVLVTGSITTAAQARLLLGVGEA